MKKQALLTLFMTLLFFNNYSQINLVKDIVAGTSNSSPIMLTDVNGILYFFPSLINAATYPELWKTNGTAAGTSLVKVMDPQYSGTNFNISYKGALYLFRGSGSLWKSDGTTAGTVLVKSFLSSFGSEAPIIFNNNLYFIETTAAGSGLYKSDGTAAGTVFISNKIGLTPVVSGATMYFVGSDTTNGHELWKTDGTAAGTTLVKNINTTTVNAGNSNPRQLTDVNGTLFFMANDGVNGNELWKSDGTEAGTVMVKNIGAGAASIATNYFTNINGTLYFTTDYFDTIWKSDGTTAGTVLVKQYLTNVNNFTNVNGTLFFSAGYGASDPYGNELWKTDGTTAGTVMVKDVRTGASSAGILECKVIDSTIYFSAINDTYGRELWKSDGTDAGTTLVQDKNSGTAWFTPNKLTVSGSKLFMAGTTAAEGLELFVYDTNTLAINNNQFAQNFNLYPNPSNGTFTIEIDQNLMGAKTTIFNLLGQKIKDFELKTTTTHQNLSKGIYLLQIEKDGNKTTKKLIVNENF